MLTSNDYMLKILIVEDDVNDFELIKADLYLVYENKVIVEHALSYSEALQRLSITNFDIVFVDNNLQDGLGIELIELSVSQDPNTPFVLITGEMSVDLDIVALDHGADDFIEKSHITPQLLRRSIPYAQGLKTMRNKVAAQSQEIEHLKNRLSAYEN